MHDCEFKRRTITGCSLNTWEEYSLAGLKAQIEDGTNKTFYCFSTDIKAA
jgi:hypothetical protein